MYPMREGGDTAVTLYIQHRFLKRLTRRTLTLFSLIHQALNSRYLPLISEPFYVFDLAVPVAAPVLGRRYAKSPVY